MQRLLTSLLVLPLAACGIFSDSSSDPADAGPGDNACQVTNNTFDQNLHDLDLLFVIQSSPAMEPYLDRIAENLTWMGDYVADRNRVPNLRVGFISANLGNDTASADGCTAEGDGAQLQNQARVEGCAAAEDLYVAHQRIPARYCPDPESRSPEVNYQGTLGQALTCIGSLGADGCAQQQPLEAALRALDGRVETNGAFLRSSAYLGVVIIAASDDTSPGEASDYLQALMELSPNRVVIGLITAPSNARLHAFADEAISHAITGNIDSQDYADVLGEIALPFRETLGWPCLHGASSTDIDPTMPGAQLDCVVVNRDATDDSESIVPRCEMATPTCVAPTSPLPCWWAEPAPESDATCHYAARLERTHANRNQAEAHCVCD